MIFYLRDQYDYNMVDIDASDTDFHVVIDIKSYSIKLLSLEAIKQEEFIRDIHGISELRGEWFEAIKPVILKFKTESTIRSYIESRLRDIGQKWDLFYLTD